MNGLVVGGKERVLAKPEHIKIIKQGVATWNAWRVENPTIDPDLAGARLGGLDLSNVDLRKGISPRRRPQRVEAHECKAV